MKRLFFFTCIFISLSVHGMKKDDVTLEPIALLKGGYVSSDASRYYVRTYFTMDGKKILINLVENYTDRHYLYDIETKRHIPLEYKKADTSYGKTTTIYSFYSREDEKTDIQKVITLNNFEGSNPFSRKKSKTTTASNYYITLNPFLEECWIQLRKGKVKQNIIQDKADYFTWSSDRNVFAYLIQQEAKKEKDITFFACAYKVSPDLTVKELSLNSKIKSIAWITFNFNSTLAAVLNKKKPKKASIKFFSVNTGKKLLVLPCSPHTMRIKFHPQKNLLLINEYIEFKRSDKIRFRPPLSAYLINLDGLLNYSDESSDECDDMGKQLIALMESYGSVEKTV